MEGLDVMVTKWVLEIHHAKRVARVSSFSFTRIIQRLVPLYGKRSKLKKLELLKSSSYFVSGRAKSPVKCPVYALLHLWTLWTNFTCSGRCVGGGLSGIEHPQICPYGAFYTEVELKSCWYEKLRA